MLSFDGGICRCPRPRAEAYRNPPSVMRRQPYLAPQGFVRESDGSFFPGWSNDREGKAVPLWPVVVPLRNANAATPGTQTQPAGSSLRGESWQTCQRRDTECLLN